MIFTKKEVSSLSGLTLREIQFYTEEGFITPLMPPQGRGKHRTYSLIGLFGFVLIKKLREMGYSAEKIKHELSTFRK